MDLHYWLRGAVFGFSVAAPVGPIGVLCIRRTLTSGRVTGFVSGLGAATADMFYGAVAAFGLTAISSLLIGQRIWIHVIGAVFLLYLGLKTLLARPATTPGSAASSRIGLAGAYASTVVLTLSNPATILSFAAVFIGLGVVGAQASYTTAGLTVVGVFCGSALWWLLLSSGVGMLRTKLTPGVFLWVNRISGLILIGFAVLTVVSLGM